MPLGHHLRAHQHIHFTVMHLGQLFDQLAFETRGVCVDSCHPQGRAIRSPQVCQHLGQHLFYFFRAVT